MLGIARSQWCTKAGGGMVQQAWFKCYFRLGHVCAPTNPNPLRAHTLQKLLLSVSDFCQLLGNRV